MNGLYERLQLWAFARRARRNYEHVIGMDVPSWYRARQIRRRRMRVVSNDEAGRMIAEARKKARRS